MVRAIIVVLSAGVLYAASLGCGPDVPDKIAFAGQSGMMQNVQINLQNAVAEEEEFKVKLWVGNMSRDTLFVNPRDIAFRLADGRILKNAEDDHDVITMQPGAGHDVEVAFKDEGHDMRRLVGGSLIVGGVWYGADPRPRVVGEIPMQRGAAVKEDD